MRISWQGGAAAIPAQHKQKGQQQQHVEERMQEQLNAQQPKVPLAVVTLPPQQQQAHQHACWPSTRSGSWSVSYCTSTDCTSSQQQHVQLHLLPGFQELLDGCSTLEEVQHEVTRLVSGQQRQAMLTCSR